MGCHLSQWEHGADSAGDVGGQKTLRSYWKNYFEKTDTLVWVVDATDRLRIEDCRDELAGLLLEEVCIQDSHSSTIFKHGHLPNALQRLMGASLLIFLNKTDVEGCMKEDEVREVRPLPTLPQDDRSGLLGLY